MLNRLNIGKKAFAVWLLWIFVCLSFWIIPGSENKTEFFLYRFFSVFDISKIYYYWDYQETFVLGVGPMIIYLFVKNVFGKIE
jgi:hypothetical protein